MDKKALYESIMSKVAKELKHTLAESCSTEDIITLTWDKMIEFNVATEDELQLVTNINGYTLETLNDILYVRTGYRNWNQYAESELDESDMIKCEDNEDDADDEDIDLYPEIPDDVDL